MKKEKSQLTDRITIPPDALEAGKDSAFNWLRSYMEDDVRVQQMTDEELTELVGAACLAMLKAWPGMDIERFAPWSKDRTIHLPMPQEARDE